MIKDNTTDALDNVKLTVTLSYYTAHTTSCRLYLADTMTWKDDVLGSSRLNTAVCVRDVKIVDLKFHSQTFSSQWQISTQDKST